MNAMNLMLAHVMGQRYTNVDSSDRNRADVIAAMLPNPFYGLIAAKTVLDGAEESTVPAIVAPTGSGGKTWELERAKIQHEVDQENAIAEAKEAAQAANDLASRTRDELGKALEQLEKLRSEVADLSKLLRPKDK